MNYDPENIFEATVLNKVNYYLKCREILNISDNKKIHKRNNKERRKMKRGVK